jgi:hypothetical protein
MSEVQADESLAVSVEKVLDEVVRQVEEEVSRVSDLRSRSRSGRVWVKPPQARNDDGPFRSVAGDWLD